MNPYTPEVMYVWFYAGNRRFDFSPRTCAECDAASFLRHAGVSCMEAGCVILGRRMGYAHNAVIRKGTLLIDGETAAGRPGFMPERIFGTWPKDSSFRMTTETCIPCGFRSRPCMTGECALTPSVYRDPQDSTVEIPRGLLVLEREAEKA